MSGQKLNEIKDKLLQQRQEIFERFQRTESGWQSLGEREIEMEEEAQKAVLTRIFDQLEELDKTAIEAIDLALLKMDTARYGICENCQKNIRPRRLEALPTARLCHQCALRKESGQ